MDKVLSIINRFLPPRISIPLILHITILSGMLYIWHLEKSVIFDLQRVYVKIPILTLAATAILLYLVLLASYATLCFKIRKKLKPKLGVLWDQHKEPYCPIHEKPFARHKTKINGNTVTGLDCIKCKKSYPLITDDGKRLTLIEAQKLL